MTVGQEPGKILADLSSAFDDFKNRHSGELADIRAAIDELAVKNAGALLNSGNRLATPTDPNYTQAFASYFRTGSEEQTIRQANGEGYRARIHASMSVTDPSSGGYLAPTEWDRKIQQEQLSTSPMRRLAQVQETSVGSYSTVWNERGTASGWVSETAARTATATPTMSSLTFAAGEIYANPAVTQRLLDDADLRVESWLAEQVSEEFNLQEGSAFISGDGSNKPRGLLTYVTGGASDGEHPGGNLTVQSSGTAGDFDADDLVSVKYGLAAPYRINSSWLMNSGTAEFIAKLKDGNGNYLWREAFAEGQPSTLLGRPVAIDENMPDIAADSIPIAFGDFRRGYLINDRMGTRILRDPYTNKPYVHFYATKRVGAGVLDPNAVRLLKLSV